MIGFIKGLSIIVTQKAIGRTQIDRARLVVDDCLAILLCAVHYKMCCTFFMEEVMQSGDKAELDRESFARAWATGSNEEQGRMLFDLVHGAYEAKDEVKRVKRQLYLLWGGIAVISTVSAPVMMKILGLLK